MESNINNKKEKTYNEYREQIEKASADFIEGLEYLNDTDRGAMAILRRNAGNTIQNSRNAMNIFYPLLPYDLPNKQKNEDILFMVATLYALHPCKSNGGNLGYTIKAMQKDYSEKTLDMRLRTLLDEPLQQNIETVSHRLRQLILMAKQKSHIVNYRRLLDDLLKWGQESRSVQKEWARAYYGQNTNNKGEKK